MFYWSLPLVCDVPLPSHCAVSLAPRVGSAKMKTWVEIYISEVYESLFLDSIVNKNKWKQESMNKWRNRLRFSQVALICAASLHLPWISNEQLGSQPKIIFLLIFKKLAWEMEREKCGKIPRDTNYCGSKVRLMAKLSLPGYYGFPLLIWCFPSNAFNFSSLVF